MNAVARLPYQVRRMQPSDIPAVVALDRRVFSDNWPESVYIQELYFNTNAYYFVLQPTTLLRTNLSWPWRKAAAAPIIGYVGGRLEADIANGHISTLAVAHDWRGRNLGEYLLFTELSTLMEAGAESVTLEVRVSNTLAQALYHKYGFKVHTTLRNYYADAEDAYLMQVAPLDDYYHRWLLEQQLELEALLAAQSNGHE